jgi:hypothetical protein
MVKGVRVHDRKRLHLVKASSGEVVPRLKVRV